MPINQKCTIAFCCVLAAGVVCAEAYESGFTAGEHAALDRVQESPRPIEMIPGERNLAERELRDRIDELEQRLAKQESHAEMAQGS